MRDAPAVMRMRLLVSGSTEPGVNLAMEEWALRRRPPAPLLFLYRNRPAVFCGRNQGLRGECDVQFCEARGIGLFRRISGGGTVFQDEGGLNVAFILPRDAVADGPAIPMALIRDGLTRLLGREVRMDSRRSLWVADRKVGGSAALWTREAVLSHCCLLVDSDLGLLERTLRSPEPERRGMVSSVRSPVANLREFRLGLGVSAVADGLIDVWRDSLDGERDPVPDRTAIEAFRRKFASRQWTFRDDDPAGAGEMAAGEWPEQANHSSQ